jgi:hypothetical protein
MALLVCRVADLFVKHTFFDPLAKGQDVLEGRHANTCVTVQSDARLPAHVV